MKKTILLLFSLIYALSITADVWKQYDKVLVTLKDRSSHEILINADSYIYCYLSKEKGAVVRIVEVGGVEDTYTFYRSDIKSIKYLESYNSIMNVDDVKVVNTLQYQDGEIKCNPHLVGKELFIYDLAGRLVKSETITIDSVVTLDRLSRGVYIAKVDEYSLKIIKR